MLTVEKVNSNMFEDVYKLLNKFENSRVNKSHWKNLFCHPWAPPEDYVGFKLQNDRTIVGFIGLIFGEREIRGEIHKFCNLTSLIVEEEYRRETLALFLEIREIEGYILTNLTPSKEVYSICKSLGFLDLEEKIKILPTLPSWKGIFSTGDRFVSVPEKIMTYLSKNDIQIFKDHMQAICKALLYVNGNDYCLIFYKTVRRKGLPFNHILFISNINLFMTSKNKILIKLCVLEKHIFHLIDSRILGEDFKGFAWDYSLPRPRQFKSDKLRKEDIDNLYSEFVLLPI
jgi:hypothetical protein